MASKTLTLTIWLTNPTDNPADWRYNAEFSSLNMESSGWITVSIQEITFDVPEVKTIIPEVLYSLNLQETEIRNEANAKIAKITQTRQQFLALEG